LSILFEVLSDSNLLAKESVSTVPPNPEPITTASKLSTDNKEL
jgi:hypothetical protein